MPMCVLVLFIKRNKHHKKHSSNLNHYYTTKNLKLSTYQLVDGQKNEDLCNLDAPCYDLFNI